MNFEINCESQQATVDRAFFESLSKPEMQVEIHLKHRPLFQRLVRFPVILCKHFRIMRNAGTGLRASVRGAWLLAVALLYSAPKIVFAPKVEIIIQKLKKP